MKRILTIVLMLATLAGTSQIKISSEEESFAFGLVSNTGKEHKTLLGAEIQYRGAIIAKAGVQTSVSDIAGGYVDLHGAVGPRLTLDTRNRLSLFALGRGAFVRRNGATNPAAGFEGGFDYVSRNGLLLGLNISRMYQADSKAVYQPEVWETFYGIALGFSWDYKK